MLENPVVIELLNTEKLICLMQPRERKFYDSVGYIAKFAWPQNTEDPIYLSVIWGGVWTYSDPSSVECAIMNRDGLLPDSGEMGWTSSAEEALKFYKEVGFEGVKTFHLTAGHPIKEIQNVQLD